MKKDKSSEHGEIARFRYKVIVPLLDEPPGSVHALARMLAQQSYDIPGSMRNRIAPTTMLDWKRQYANGGFEALKPKQRCDRNQSRGMDVDVADTLIELKRDNPHLSVRMVIDEAYRRGLVDRSTHLAKSTVHRLLLNEGLMTKAENQIIQDLRKFAYQFAGQMWQTDVMHGPKVKDEQGRHRKTYLLAMLDDATRVIPYAKFAFSENTRSFLPVLREGIERRGIPKRLFADNGAVYRSKQLDIICAKLGIALIHARPYAPTSKGKDAYYTFLQRSVQNNLCGVCLR